MTKDNNMEAKLRTLQLTELEILKVIDKVCRDNDIPYSLYAGSLLGAVRHKGFIPWDDDLDICMSRENYNRFLAAWEKASPEGYLLQNKDNAPGFTQSFTKIRKDHTTFWQEGEEVDQYHTGIFVDVFPIDRIPNGKLRRKLFRLEVVLYQVYTREFIPPQESALIRAATKAFYSVTTKKFRASQRRKLEKKLTRYNGDTTLDAIAIETINSMKTCYPADMLDSYVDMPFEDCTVMGFAKWDENLTRKFGDYMQLPPEEKRTWAHYPLCIDFEKNYEEIEE